MGLRIKMESGFRLLAGLMGNPFSYLLFYLKIIFVYLSSNPKNSNRVLLGVSGDWDGLVTWREKIRETGYQLAAI